MKIDGLQNLIAVQQKIANAIASSPVITQMLYSKGSGFTAGEITPIPGHAWSARHKVG